MNNFFSFKNLIVCLLLRSRTPQPPAEDEEENIDDTLVTIDTCKFHGGP